MGKPCSNKDHHLLKASPNSHNSLSSNNLGRKVAPQLPLPNRAELMVLAEAHPVMLRPHFGKFHLQMIPYQSGNYYRTSFINQHWSFGLHYP
jgi:hypothetical protein